MSHFEENLSFSNFSCNSFIKLPQPSPELFSKIKMKTLTNIDLEEKKKTKKPNLLRERIRLKKLKELQKKQPKKIIKICDFGLSRSSAIPVQTLTNEVVTLWYRSPELLLGSTKYNQSCDLWSVGCIFAEIITNRPLFLGKNIEEQLNNIFEIRGSPESNDWQEASSLPNFNLTLCQSQNKQNLKDILKYSDINGSFIKFLKLSFNLRT